MRIASLLPSATEIVYALGLEEHLVAVTFECDEPAEARRDKHVVVGGLDTAAMDPGEIDRQVRETLARGGDLYTLDEGAMAQFRPDLILTQDLCRVCAVPTGQVDDALRRIGCEADVLTLDPHTLTDVLTTILDVGRRAGCLARAEALVGFLRSRLDDVARRVAQLPRPRVAVLEWADPPFSAGHWVPDLVWAAGGEPVSLPATHRSVPTTFAAVREARPDVVVVAPCGFGLDGAAAQAESILEHLPAVPVWAIDADGLVVRPGPRLVAGVEALASVFHEPGSGDPAAVRQVR